MMIAAFVVVWTAVAAVKLSRFAFNGLDLGIYTQVLWNTAHGHWFEFSIHHQSYLGDHVELGLAVLAPLFRLLPSSLTLMAAQALAVGLAAWPLGRLAGRRLGLGWAVFVTFAYLANPFVLNTIMYEFHFLPFALLPIFFCLDAFDEQRYGRFLAAFVVALFIREDVALVLMMFPVLALLERRHWRWVAPVVLALGWFAATLWLTGHLNPNGQYKFLAYYRWLGLSLPDMVHTTLTRPWIFVDRLLTWENVNLFVGILLPFAFLSALKRRGLWLAGPIFLQLFFMQEVSGVIFKIHYTVLLLPGLFYGFILGIGALTRDPHPPAWARWAQYERGMAAALLTTVVLYASLVIGPVIPLVRAAGVDAATRERLRAERTILDLVPPNAGVAVGYTMVADAAERTTLSSVHYIFLGKQQYSEVPFVLPAETQFIVLDRRDTLLYHALYREHEGDNDGGDERLLAVIRDGRFGVVAQVGDFLLLERDRGETPLFFREDTAFKLIQGTLLTDGVHVYNMGETQKLTPRTVRVGTDKQEFLELPLEITMSTDGVQQKNLLGVVQITRDGRTVAEYETVISPLFPTTNWQPGVPVTWTDPILLPPSVHSGDTVRLEVRNEQDRPWLDGWGTIVPKLSQRKVLGSVELGVIQR